MDEKTRLALERLIASVTAAGERQVSLEDRIKAVEETQLTDSSKEAGAEKTGEKGTETPLTVSSDVVHLQEIEAENVKLHEQAELYESPAYTSEIISRWAHGLTPEDYIELGVKLGFQDVLAEEEGQDPELLGDVNLEGGPQIMFSKAVPDGETGWMKSKSLDCFVKVES